MSEDVMKLVSKQLSQTDVDLMNEVKRNGNEMHFVLEMLTQAFPGSGRELALAKTKLEEMVMWAVKGITK